jgi:hypothetical protein
MFDNPDIMRQLVDGRMRGRRDEAAIRRIAGATRTPRGRRGRLRLPTTWISGRYRRRPRGVPTPAPACPPSL